MTRITANPKQALVISCPCNEILYGGAAGSSKTYCIILDWIAHHERHKGKAKGLILRHTYAELKDIMNEVDGIFATLPNSPKWNNDDKSYYYTDGAILELGYLDVFKDVKRYIGRSFNWRGNDELTQWPTDEEYEILNTRMRSTDDISVRVISATNPGDVGHNWVMHHWKIDENPAGMKPIVTETLLPDGRTIKWSRVFIPGKLEDNKPLDDSGAYRANLMNKPEHLRKMLLEGRWDVVEGNYFAEWNPEAHICKAFIPPASWKRWMAADWGTATPYAIGWWTRAPDGTIYCYRELYGDGGKPNLGSRETADQVAEKIRRIENEAGEYIKERYLDSSCFSPTGQDLSIGGIFAHNGVHFQEAYRKNKADAIENFRSYLKVVNGVSALRFMDNCVHHIRTIPRVQTDRNHPGQYDTDGEDHCADEAVYALRRYMTDPKREKHSSYQSQMDIKFRNTGKRGYL